MKTNKTQAQEKQPSPFKFSKLNNTATPHAFMCEELLTPFTNHCDYQRLNLFSAHINQLVHLKKPEYPRVFTNFETQIGEYSTAYKRAYGNLIIVAKIVKNPYNYTLIVQDEDTGVFDVIEYHTAQHIAEDYGYKSHDCVAALHEGDVIPKGDFIYKSAEFDEYGNVGYGVNLNAVYYNFLNLTYEDGIVVSESAAKKLTSYKTKKVMVSINNNDIILNVHGDNEHYKAFPHVGDHHDNILCAIRKRTNKTIFYDLQPHILRTIDQANDDVIYSGGGVVADVKVFSNVPLGVMKSAEYKNFYTQEIIDLYEEDYMYHRALAEALEQIIPVAHRYKNDQNIAVPIKSSQNPNKYTDNVAYLWKVSHEYINNSLKWRDDYKEFGYVKMEFTILKEDELAPGCKITGLYGNKGVVSKIIPDAEMPICVETGEPVDVCLNCLGVIARINPGQLFTQHIDFMSKHILLQLKEMKTLKEKEKLFFEYLYELNPKEADFMAKEYADMDTIGKEYFFQDILDHGIYIHEPPMYGNTAYDKLVEITQKHPDWVTPFHFDGVDKPMVMGAEYFIRLKHQASNKTSIRSARNLNIKNLPPRSALKKDNKIQFNNNALRWGRMEVNQLFLTKRPEIIERFLKMYSTDSDARADLIKQLTLPGVGPDNKRRNPFNMEIDTMLNTSINRKILEKYLNIIGVEINDDYEGEFNGN